MPIARSGRRWRCGAGPTSSARSACCRASPTASRSSCRKRSSRRRPIAGLFLIAPIITFTVALIAWAVIPFGPGVVLADINVGLLYILAVSSLGVYGVIIAGLGVQLQISLLFGAPRRRADGQLRSLDRLRAGPGRAVGGHASTSTAIVEAQQRPCLRLHQRLRLQSAAVPDGGGVPDLVAWPKPRARRST